MFSVGSPKMRALVIVFVVTVPPFMACNPCSRSESLNITDGTTLPNGNIMYGGIEYSQDTWYEVEEDGVKIRLGCPCIGRICVWKCCKAGEAYYNRSCSQTDIPEVNPFNPPVFNEKIPSNVTAQQHFFFLYEPTFDKYSVDSNTPKEEFFLQQNGTLYEIFSGNHQWHPLKRYCLDMMVDDNSPVPRLVAGVAYPEEDSSDNNDILHAAYAVGLIISVPFLLATFLVYAFIPELRNLHGMCLMAYCSGLFVAYSFLAYLKFPIEIRIGMTGCYVIAFIIYYAFQTSFFWLNVMCFDIWRTFSGYRGGSSNKRRENKRFAAYGAYAWGVPMILTAITVAMQFSNDLPSNIVTPGFGSRRCWFNNRVGELVYFYGPVLVLVVCNVVFFTITSYRIRSIKQETAILKSAESSRSDRLKRDTQRYGLYLKLFIVMGVNWSVEIISFAVDGFNWYWIVVDISNISLGFFIFLIFVWKNKVRNLVAKKWRSIRGKRATADSNMGRWTTQSSSAPTEDTRISHDESAIRLKEMH